MSWGNRCIPYVEPGTRFTAIAAAGPYTVALTSHGSVVAWGWNEHGETDVPVTAQSGMVAIAAGYHQTPALNVIGRRTVRKQRSLRFQISTDGRRASCKRMLRNGRERRE